MRPKRYPYNFKPNRVNILDSCFYTQPPIGLSSTIDDLPSDLKMCVEDYDRLANDYQEETRNNDSLRRQNTNLLQENGRLLYKEMTMDFRKHQRKWGARA